MHSTWVLTKTGILDTESRKFANHKWNRIFWTIELMSKFSWLGNLTKWPQFCHTPSQVISHCRIVAEGYHPHSNFWRLENWDPCSPLVNKSAICWSVLMCSISKSFPMCSLNQWYFTAMCLEVEVKWGEVATVMAPWLSSKTVLLVIVEKSSGRSRTEMTF